MAFTAMVDDHSEFDLATAPGLLVHSNFQRVFSIEVPCLSLESPSLHCKKRENSTSSDTKVRSRSLQQEAGDAVAFSKIDLDGSSLIFFDQSKK